MLQIAKYWGDLTSFVICWPLTFIHSLNLKYFSKDITITHDKNCLCRFPSTLVVILVWVSASMMLGSGFSCTMHLILLVPMVNYQFYELQCAGFPLAQCSKLISGTTCLFVGDKYLRKIPQDVSLHEEQVVYSYYSSHYSIWTTQC